MWRMRVFLTGASGYIGTAVLDAFVRAGHQVTGLVRNSEKAAEVAARGGVPLTGDLHDPASYRQAAVWNDVFIHAGFDGVRPAETDRLAIETLIAAARAGRAIRPSVLIYTSGIWVLGPTRRPAAEDAAVNPAEIVTYRPAHEQMVLSAAGDGLRTLVVRPGIVYGGSRGIVGDLFRHASDGVIRIIGTGENRWPTVYDRDLAELYLLLAQNAGASGVFHANDESDERVNDIVAAIVAHVSPTPDVRRVPLEEAQTRLGPYALALALDQVVRSPRAHALGWAPELKSIAGNVARLFEEWRADSAARAQEQTSGPPTPDRPAATRSRRRSRPAGE
jgi:nucleoside-diphosphate-sugar epimerase